MIQFLRTGRVVLIAGATALAALGARSSWAQSVDVQGAWVRATVPGQKATGAFMTITAPNGATLVGVRTPVAGVAGVHEMKMDGGIMKMREMPAGLELPAGKPVALTPGTYHVMLMDLKLPVRPNTSLPLTLVLKDAKGVEFTQEVKAPVSTLAPSSAPAEHEMHH